MKYYDLTRLNDGKRNRVYLRSQELGKVLIMFRRAAGEDAECYRRKWCDRAVFLVEALRDRCPGIMWPTPRKGESRLTADLRARVKPDELRAILKDCGADPPFHADDWLAGICELWTGPKTKRKGRPPGSGGKAGTDVPIVERLQELIESGAAPNRSKAIEQLQDAGIIDDTSAARRRFLNRLREKYGPAL